MRPGRCHVQARRALHDTGWLRHRDRGGYPRRSPASSPARGISRPPVRGIRTTGSSPRRLTYHRPLPVTASPRPRESAEKMRFSLYSELQLHPGKTAEQLYGEVLEQMENADRLGYDVYAAIEHFFYPEVLGLGQSDGALRRRRAADEEPALPHHAARTAVPQPDRAGRRHPRDGHPHGRPVRMGRRPRARLARAARRGASRRARAPQVRGGRRPAAEGARERALLPRGRVLHGHGLARRPVRRAQVPRLPRRNVGPHLHARRRAGLGRRGAAAAPVRRAGAADRSLPRRAAPSTAPRRTSSGSTRATSTRIARQRIARRASG